MVVSRGFIGTMEKQRPETSREVAISLSGMVAGGKPIKGVGKEIARMRADESNSHHCTTRPEQEEHVLHHFEPDLMDLYAHVNRRTSL